MAGIIEETPRPTTVEEAVKLFERDGFAGLKDYCDKLEKKPNKIDIGVVGSSGSGKSCLVNSLIGVTDDDEVAAPVGETETTNERRKYASKILSGVNVWDVPGVGTQKHPRTTYLERQGILMFDLVLIVSRSRFTEDDTWLVTQLIQHNRQFFFVRTYIDNDVMSSSRRNRISRDGEMQHQVDTMQRVRRDCLRQLQTCLPDIEEDKIFLVCSYEPDKYEFHELKRRIDTDGYVRTSTLHGIRQSIRRSYMHELNRKKEALEKQLLADAAPSALMSAVPIPGVGFVGDVAYTTKMFNNYRQKFNIDDENLQKMVRDFGTEIQKQLPNREIDTSAAAGLLPYRGVAFIAKFVPVLGSAVAAGVAYTGTYKLLHQMILLLHQDALNLHHYMLSRIMGTVTHEESITGSIMQPGYVYNN